MWRTHLLFKVLLKAVLSSGTSQCLWTITSLFDYLCSSIRTLPHKGLHCVLLDSTLGKLNLRLWTRVRELFLCFTNFFSKLFCQVESPTVCEPSQVYLSSTCCQEIGLSGKDCFRHWVAKNHSLFWTAVWPKTYVLKKIKDVNLFFFIFV